MQQRKGCHGNQVQQYHHTLLTHLVTFQGESDLDSLSSCVGGPLSLQVPQENLIEHCTRGHCEALLAIPQVQKPGAVSVPASQGYTVTVIMRLSRFNSLTAIVNSTKYVHIL